MTTRPKCDQYVGVSTTTRPVTHVALVAVNTATTVGGMPSGPVPPSDSESTATGAWSSAAPMAITASSPSGMMRTGDRNASRPARRAMADGVRSPPGSRRRTDHLGTPRRRESGVRVRGEGVELQRVRPRLVAVRSYAGHGRAAKASIWSTWPDTMSTSSGCTLVEGIA